MILTESTTEVNSNLGVESYEMSFDAEGAAHIMRTLSNMYRDKSMAVLREYCANAIDSHIEAGNPAPIEVTLPNEWSPDLIITDHGVGLDAEDIRTVYSVYGKSTKGTTNNQIGAFGIGAKSAFTIGSQFVVTGIKDGQKTVTLFSLDHNGKNSVSPISQSNTDEPNGVTVKVAVTDHEAMRVAAAKLFSTWKPGTVLVDGEEPEYIWDKVLKVTDTVFAKRNKGSEYITLVMGGIGYQATYSMLVLAKPNNDSTSAAYKTWDRLVSGSLSLIAKIDNGSVDITPSREDLRDTPRTLAVLQDVIKEYANNIDQTLSDAIDNQPTATHAAMKLHANSQFIGDFRIANFTYKGAKLPYEVKLPWSKVTMGYGRNGKRSGTLHYPTEVHLGEDLSKVLIITGVTTTNEAVRRMANRVMDNSGYNQWYIADSTSGREEWFAFGSGYPIATKPFLELRDEYRALLPKSSGTGGAVEYNTNQGSMTMAELKDANERIFYTRPHQRGTTSSLFLETFKDDIVVRLSNRHSTELFTKRLRRAQHYLPTLEKAAEKIVANVTEEDKQLITHRPNTAMERLKLITDHVGDNNFLGPDVANYIERQTTKSSGGKDYSELLEAYGVLGQSIQYGSIDYDGQAAKVFAKFPLLNAINIQRTWNHVSGNYENKTDKLGLDHAVLYVKVVLDSEKDQTDEEEK